MPQNKVLPFRVQPLWNTTAGWNADTVTIPVFGELVCEQTGGVPLYKIGDGINIYNDLSYLSVPESDYLGMATTTTSPPSLTTDAYYFTVVTGNFIYLGGIVVPATSLFAIISYSFSTTSWSYSVIIDTSTFPAPTLQAVLNAGNTASDASGGQRGFVSYWTAEDADVVYDASVGILGSIGSNEVFFFGFYGTTTPSWGIGDGSGNLAIFAVPTGETLASIEQGYGIPVYRGGTLALIGDGVTPTATLSTGAGTGATLTFGTNSDDNSGTITLTTAGTPAASATIVTITFSTPYIGKAIVILTPANAVTARLSGVTQVWAATNEPATEFVITSETTGLTTSTIYKWNYAIIQ